MILLGNFQQRVEIRAEPVVAHVDQVRFCKMLVRYLKTPRFQQDDVLSRCEVGLGKSNRSHTDKKRPTDLSIAKRLGGFYCCKYRDNFLSAKKFLRFIDGFLRMVASGRLATGGEVAAYAIDMEIDDGLLAFGAEEEGVVGAGVHEEVFYEDAGAEGVAEDVEVGFEVGVAVGVVGTEALAGEVELGGFIQACGQGIGLGVASGGVGAPAGCIEPLGAVPSGVTVDGDEDDVVFAEAAAEVVDAAATLGQRDVFLFRNEEAGIVAKVGQGRNYPGCNQAVPGVFAEDAVGAALAGSVDAVTVVDEDFHG